MLSLCLICLIIQQVLCPVQQLFDKYLFSNSCNAFKTVHYATNPSQQVFQIFRDFCYMKNCPWLTALVIQPVNQKYGLVQASDMLELDFLYCFEQCGRPVCLLPCQGQIFDNFNVFLRCFFCHSQQNSLMAQALLFVQFKFHQTQCDMNKFLCQI